MLHVFEFSSSAGNGCLCIYDSLVVGHGSILRTVQINMLRWIIIMVLSSSMIQFPYVKVDYDYSVHKQHDPVSVC